jgi:chromosome transmission fidelity protein 18
LDVNAIKSTALGLKDTQTSVSAVWDKLFKIPSKKRQKGIEDHTSGKYVTPLVKDIITCGEYDRLAQSEYSFNALNWYNIVADLFG